MPPQKFVVRLLDAAGALLAWATVYARPSPQPAPAASCPFLAPGPTTFVIESDGLAVALSIHWCDLDVARLQMLDPVQVQAGQVFAFAWLEPLWLVAGMRDVPLPPVTVRAPVAITVPLGQLTAQTPP